MQKGTIWDSNYWLNRYNVQLNNPSRKPLRAQAPKDSCETCGYPSPGGLECESCKRMRLT